MTSCISSSVDGGLGSANTVSERGDSVTCGINNQTQPGYAQSRPDHERDQA